MGTGVLAPAVESLGCFLKPLQFGLLNRRYWNEICCHCSGGYWVSYLGPTESGLLQQRLLEEYVLVLMWLIFGQGFGFACLSSTACIRWSWLNSSSSFNVFRCSSANAESNSGSFNNDSLDNSLILLSSRSICCCVRFLNAFQTSRSAVRFRWKKSGLFRFPTLDPPTE